MGQKSVTTDSGGDAALTFKKRQKVPKGQLVTATATDPDGNNSEFSAALTVA